MRVLRGKGSGEDGRQRGNGAIHQAGQARLYDSQDKVAFVTDKLFNGFDFRGEITHPASIPLKMQERRCLEGQQSPIFVHACPSQIIMPPETSIRCALTQRLSSVSSDAIIGPMSSGSPGRPSAVASDTILFTAGLSRTTPPLKSV